MAREKNGQQIVCDGAGCTATAVTPVALQPTLSQPVQTVEGWLFVSEHETWQHYCPDCALHYLNGLSIENENLTHC